MSLSLLLISLGVYSIISMKKLQLFVFCAAIATFMESSIAFEQTISYFKKSQYYQNLSDQIKDSKKVVENLEYQTPLSVNASYQRSQNFISNANATGQDVEGADSFETSVNYVRRNSLNVSASGGYEDNRYEEPNGLPNNSSNNYFVGLRGEYSLTQGGSRSLSELSQQSQISSSKINLYTLSDQVNSQMNQYFQIVTDYFVNQCKLGEDSKLAEIVEASLSKGKKLFQAEQISRRDYLNYLDLYNNFQSKIQNDSLVVAQLKNQLLFYLQPKDLKQLEQDNKNYCAKYQTYNQTITQYAAVFEKNFPQSKTLFNQTYSYLGENEKITRNNIDKKLLKVRQTPNVKPFAELRATRPDFLDDKNYSVLFGVSMNWDTPSKETRSGIELANFRSNYFPNNILVSKANYLRDFNQSFITFKTQMSVYKTLLANLQSVNLLLQYFDAQRGVQEVNSINYSNTLLRKSDILNGLHDVVGTVEKQNFQFQVLLDNSLIDKIQ